MVKAFLALAPIALLLAGCQTMTERVADRARLVCFQSGYGETSPRHEECMRAVQPVGREMERKAAAQRIDEGLALMAAGLRQNGVP